MNSYLHKTTVYFIEKNLDLQLYSFNDNLIPLDDLEEDLNNIDDETALNKLNEEKPKNWRFLIDGGLSFEVELREWKKYLLLKEIEEEIKPFFINSLEKCNESINIKPYNEKDLRGLKVDDECLVDLLEFIKFQKENEILGKYSICLPIRNQMLRERILFSFLEFKNNPQVRIKIRLDPLLRYPVCSGSFERLYGKGINWEYLSQTRVDVTADYMDYETGVKTQIFWEKIDNDNLQFFCEELPLYSQINERGSKFFHAIYNIETKLIIHLDASTTIYSHETFLERNSVKLWELNSWLGENFKIYRIDGEIDRDLFALVVSSYFMGNNDIKSHFNELNSDD